MPVFFCLNETYIGSLKIIFFESAIRTEKPIDFNEIKNALADVIVIVDVFPNASKNRLQRSLHARSNAANTILELALQLA